MAYRGDGDGDGGRDGDGETAGATATGTAMCEWAGGSALHAARSARIAGGVSSMESSR